MKISNAILAVSLLLNVGLVTTLALRAPGAKRQEVGRVEPALQPSVTAAAVAPETWEALSTSDLALERDHLRAAGFPPRIVRAILLARVREGTAAQWAALDAAAADAPFWKPGLSDPATAETRRALAKTEQKLLRDLLGREADTNVSDSLRRQFPGFAPEKLDQLAAIKQQFDDEREDVIGRVFGTLSSDQRQQLAALEKKMHSDFAAVLTPSELEQYDLRVSSIANRIRNEMRAFDPTEAEFRAIYKLQADFEETYSSVGSPLSPEEMRLRSDARKKLQSDIAAAVGPERAKEHERASDWNFQRTVQLTDRLHLPSQTAKDLFALEKEFTQRRDALYQSSPGDPEAFRTRTEQAKGLETEAAARLQALLNGDAKAFEAYKTNCGHWLRLAPTIRTATPPKG